MRSKADFVSEVLGRVWYIFEIIQNTAAVCCYGEIRRGIASYNQLVHALPDTEVDRRSTTFIGNQAYSLHREYLEALLARRGSEIVITDKLDGVRVLLFFTDRDVWMIGRDLSFTRLLNLNDVPRSAALPDLRGTLLDCELMTTTKPWPASIEHRVHVFDVLFFKRDDLRDSKQHGLFQRLSTAAHALRQFQHLGIIMKEYYRGKAQIYHRLQRGLHGSQDWLHHPRCQPTLSARHLIQAHLQVQTPPYHRLSLWQLASSTSTATTRSLTWNEPVEYRCPRRQRLISWRRTLTPPSPGGSSTRCARTRSSPITSTWPSTVKRCLQEKIDLVEELCSDAGPGKPHASNEPTYLDCIIRDHIATGHASEPGKGYRCPDQVTPSDSYVRLMVLTDAQRTLDLCKRFPTKYKLVNGGHGDDEDYDVLREARVSLQCTGPYGTFPLIYQDVAVTAMLDKGFQLEHAHSIIDHDRWLVKYRKQYECMGDDEREFARACLVYVFRRRSTAEDAAWVPVPAKAVALLSVHLVFGKQPKMRKIVADFNDTLSGILLTESPMVIDGPNTNWADVAKKVALDIYIYNDATGGLSVHRSTHSTVSSLGVALYQPAADQVYVVGETNTTPSLGLFRILRSAVKNAPPIVSVAPAIEPPIQIQVQQDEPRDMDMEMDMEVDKPEEPQQPQQEAEPEMAVVIADEEMAKWTLVKLRDFARTHKINLKGSKSKSELLEHIGAHMKKQ
ncbi:uncharacterized protein BJ171DRAFT_542417 [Polychytrium aggregatum]|uniref:uncharacterized protein n=1 Tax=Polychytrium aggregatum TaxID=110093 RepID=UPI0022FDB77B|nr:uncharacterized protein BJ171DRAFT_542417 [Polychytrium aggregatum]KAI9190680.1 hypothetical protein BJ171DRAFT_542417 [Polychytrium aggregatum]